MIARVILALIALAGPLSVVFSADDPAQLDRERRVRVALALATAPARTVPAIAPAPRAADCGQCRADLDAVRAEARKTGKPIVLFIGGCFGRAAELAGQSVILARADTYDVDGQGTKKRIVIIARDEFSPLKLMAVRSKMIERGWTRKTINDHVSRVARCWSWGVTQEVLPAAVADALKHVPGLVAGRNENLPESSNKTPVPAGHIEAIFPHLNTREPRRAILEAMIRFQLLTGMRPGEVCAMKWRDLQQMGEFRRYKPADGGKMYHLDKPRMIWIGPRGQAILDGLNTPRSPAGDERVFCLPPRNKDGIWVPFTVKALRNAIHRACARAGVPNWSPHQLRHTRATEIMRRYEDDRLVAAALGDTPEMIRTVYAQNPEEEAAKRVARELG